MEKVKKIINSISWVIVALTGILLIVKWNDIPALVITHQLSLLMDFLRCLCGVFCLLRS